jgi:hypothetical protein
VLVTKGTMTFVVVFLVSYHSSCARPLKGVAGHGYYEEGRVDSPTL